MFKRNRFLIFAIVFALLLIGSVFAYNTLSKNYKPNIEGVNSQTQSQKQAASDFTVKDNSGNDVKLSDFKGKPVVINFWASWCPPCRGEMPDYNKLYLEYSKKGIVFMMVDLTDGERETTAIGKKFIKDNGYQFPVYFDTNQGAAYIYGISSIPDSIFVDKSGMIINSFTGAIDEGTMRSNMEALLK